MCVALALHATREAQHGAEHVLDALLVDLRFLRVPASEHISADIVGEFATAVWLLAVTSGVDPGRSTC